MPNLRQRAFAHLGWLVKARVLRLDVPAPPADEREQRIFLIYSLLAAWYITSIMLRRRGHASTAGSTARSALAGGALFVARRLADVAGARSGAWRQTAAAAWRELRARAAARRLRDRLAHRRRRSCSWRARSSRGRSR